MDSIILLEYRGDEYGSRERDRFSISYDELQELMQHQQGVTSNLKVAGERLATNSDTDNDVASQAIAAAQSHGKHLSSLVERVWKLVPPLKHTSDRTAAKAQEVFSTPELLEKIMSNLASYDKLQAMQVQRTWRDTVLGSIRLKRELGLLPFGDGKYYSAFSERFQPKIDRWTNPPFPGGYYDDSDPSDFRWDEDSEYSWWTINHQVCEDPTLLEVRIKLRAKIKVGSRVASMRLFDPPVLAVKAFSECRNNSGHGGKPWCYNFRSANDCFTIGELLKIAPRVRAEHAECMVRPPDMESLAVIKLSEEDMVMVERRWKEQQAIARRANRRAERQRKREEREKAKQKVNAWHHDSVGHRITEPGEDVHGDSEGHSEEDDEFDDEQSGDDDENTYDTNEQDQFGDEEGEGGSSDPGSEAEDYASELGDKAEGTDLEIDESWVEEGDERDDSSLSLAEYRHDLVRDD